MPGLRLVPREGVLDALRGVMAGDPPIAPMPDAEVEVARLVGALRPEEPVTEADAAVVVATSGSTGTPRGVVLSREAIRAAVTATHARLGGPGTWVCPLPTHYVAGLMCLARAVVAGTEPVVVSPGLDELPALDAGTPAYISVVPAQLYRVLGDRDLTEAMRRFDAVLVGGAAVAGDQLSAARDAGIAVVTTYGMSETCGGVVYDGVPLDGVRVDVAAGGQLSITSPTVFSGYRLDPEETRRVLDGRTFRTSDLGEWDRDRLVVRGRSDDVVVSGGVNVDLAALQRIVDATCGPDVVAVLSVPHPRWGQQVVAVTTDDLTLEQVHERLEGLVGTGARPAELRQVGELPRTSSGKIDRQAIASGWER